MIPFNKPYISSRALENLSLALSSNRLSGDGEFTKHCHQLIENDLNVKFSLLTHSGSAALEMMAILANVGPGDEVIMPSFTFVSTANAFALRGAIPIFIDIRPDTLNLDEKLIESAISKKTKAVVVVHYAGVACEMDTIKEITSRNGLLLLEDAAQAYSSKYKGKYLGGIGDIGALSFHETKNIIAGEGGALLTQNSSAFERAKIVREKGTNRSAFFEGKADKYSWVDIGSSYLPSELNAALLFEQLRNSEKITQMRREAWNYYNDNTRSFADRYNIQRPSVPRDCEHNGHMYYIVTENKQQRASLLSFLQHKNITATSHYVPLHSSTGGKKFGVGVGSFYNTDRVSECLVRLPLFPQITRCQQDQVIENMHEFYSGQKN